MDHQDCQSPRAMLVNQPNPYECYLSTIITLDGFYAKQLKHLVTRSFRTHPQIEYKSTVNEINAMIQDKLSR